ncbi:hypothetical protein COT42_04000 [Candidatus Saganbacteria bacterium CG08_land_8_20_14_0_20_45_16]|uniref:Uncharacterized protein n=1 Tax=Candidatus Saganbacteria bacterium CG08_land_8_20_14_0_20_45_16 TaxID=2014293 RepID=A0A2H0XYP3_UNCSA|nr:MAG: hypothetical protein COT42_04000 [Candidatus Saganbacteria bacterium CG08_land_8_20_14_0_20_45_16]
MHDGLAQITAQAIAQDLKQLDPVVASLLQRPNRARGKLARITTWLNQCGSLTIDQLSSRIGWRTFPEVFFIKSNT